MANSAAGPNPVLLVREHIGEHISELEGKRSKLLEKVREIDEQLAVARTLKDVVGASASERPTSLDGRD